MQITPSNHLDLCSNDDTEFVPTTESLEVPSHLHQHFPRGDIQEEFELELAIRLSKGDDLSADDEFTIELASETLNLLYEDGIIKKFENALSSAQNSHGYKTIYVTHYLCPVRCVQSYLQWFGLTQC